MYRISHELEGNPDSRFPVEIDFCKIGSLRPHEETLEEKVESLCSSVEEKGTIDHPVVAEKGTGIVLDGMHRVQALARLGCGRVPVQWVDLERARYLYDKGFLAEPLLQSWFWVVFPPTAGPGEWWAREGLVVEKPGWTFASDEFPGAEELLDRVLEAVNHRRDAAAFISLTAREVLFLRSPGSTVNDLARDLDRLLREGGYFVSYATGRMAVSALAGGRAAGIIVLPVVTMEEVRAAAVGRLLPPKRTRFVLPARVLFLSLPLELLRGESGREPSIEDFLEGRKPRRIKGPVLLDRLYSDPWIYVFDRP